MPSSWPYREGAEPTIPEGVQKFVDAVTPYIDKKDYKGVRTFLQKEHTRQIDNISQVLGINDENQAKEIKTDLVELTASDAQRLIENEEITVNDLLASHHNQKISRQEELDGIATWHFEDNFYPQEPNDKRLQGFIMTVKDSIFVKDAPVTSGLMINLDRIPLEESDMVQKLRKAGACITTKGAIPMLLMSMECESNIWGVGRNPYDPSRTVGGSSGGDSALVKCGFVNASLGSDVAGSVRVPALCNGIHGFKPSPRRLGVGCQGNWYHRWYGTDHFSPCRADVQSEPQSTIACTVGPTARCVEDIEKIMEVLCEPCEHEFDMNIVPMPWNNTAKFKKRIGLFREIPFCPPSKASLRALKMGQEALESQGYEVVDLSDKLGPLFNDCHYGALQCFDKSKGLLDVIHNRTSIHEPVSELYTALRYISRIPQWMMKGLTWAGAITGRMKSLVENAIAAQSTMNSELVERQMLIYRKIMRIMKDADVDALLSPGLPVPAPTHLSSNSMMWICSYLYVFNFLQMPSGVLTTTHVREDEQEYEDDYNDDMTAGIKKVMENSIGMPMGISITAPCYKDEVVVAIMKDIESSGKLEPCSIRTPSKAKLN